MDKIWIILYWIILDNIGTYIDTLDDDNNLVMSTYMINVDKL